MKDFDENNLPPHIRVVIDPKFNMAVAALAPLICDLPITVQQPIVTALRRAFTRLETVRPQFRLIEPDDK